jgi:hypothetical protein
MNIPNSLLSLFALNILDAWSTIMCIGKGLNEANPFIRYLLDAGIFLEYKFLFGFGLLIVSFYYSKQETQNQSFMRGILLVMCAIYTSVVLNNFQLIL